MPEPVTVGALVATALAFGAGELAKGVLGAAAKDAYGKLKSLLGWATTEVANVEAKPDSQNRQGVLAEKVDERPAAEQSEARALAAALVEAIKMQVAANGPVGIDIGRLEALEVDLGRIEVRAGTGFRAREVKTYGAFKTGPIVISGDEPGKS